MVNVESHELQCHQILSFLFGHSSNSFAPQQLVSQVTNREKIELSAEESFLWKAYLIHIKSKVEEFEEKVPDANTFRQLLQTNQKKDFVLKQILEVMLEIDLSDEATIRLLSLTLRECLSAYYFTEKTVENAVCFLKRCYPREEDFSR